MNIQKFHETYFPNKHRNSTYRKINKISSDLENKGIIKININNKYKTIVINKPEILFEIVKEIKLL